MKLSAFPGFGRRSRRLARLARQASARARAAYAAASGFLPREYRHSRIMGAEGASGVRFADGTRLDASPRSYVPAQRVAARPVQCDAQRPQLARGA